MYQDNSQAGRRKTSFTQKIREVIRLRGSKIAVEFSAHWIEVALVISFLGSFNKNRLRAWESELTVDSVNAVPVSQVMNTSLLNPAEAPKDKANWGNTYSNLIYTEGDFATDDKARARAIKRLKQKQYIEKYVTIAQQEMESHGIPASITLAQGLLESNVGESKLATMNNNHFGLKCFSKTCKRGHCSNFEDDSHKDFFRKFQSPEESFAAHSKLLQKPRYKSLFDLVVTDFEGWAHGLKKAGYATDPKYGYKLINLIKDLQLHQYDAKEENAAAEGDVQ